jgi:molybdopterin synthase catalytic subunit
MEINIKIVKQIDTSIVYQSLSHQESGGVCVFIGSVRNLTNKQIVNKLFFEAYESMAVLEMEKIVKVAFEKWDLQKVIMHHAVGEKKIGDPVVLVGASSAHRESCFQACRFLIDTLKENVPIWKKEFFENNEVWVTPHP